MFAVFFLAGSRHLRANDARPANEATILDLHAYEAELERDSTLIERIKNQPAEIYKFRKSLPADWTVRMDDTEFQVSTQPLGSALADLQTRPKNADSLAHDIESRLAEMRQSAIELEKPSGEVSASAARAHLDKVFRRREFEGLKGPSGLQLLEARIGRWIARVIGRLLQRLHISAKTGNFLAWSVIALAFLTIGYWAFRTLSRHPRRNEIPALAPAAPSDSRAIALAHHGNRWDSSTYIPTSRTPCGV